MTDRGGCASHSCFSEVRIVGKYSSPEWTEVAPSQREVVGWVVESGRMPTARASVTPLVSSPPRPAVRTQVGGDRARPLRVP